MGVELGEATVETASHESSVTTSVRVFGGVGVDGHDGPVSIGGPRQRRLLALLTAMAGTVVSIDWLAEYLWDDDDRPDATTPAIRTYLSRLRQSLPSDAQDWVETAPSGYVLSAPADAVEADGERADVAGEAPHRSRVEQGAVRGDADAEAQDRQEAEDREEVRAA